MPSETPKQGEGVGKMWDREARARVCRAAKAPDLCPDIFLSCNNYAYFVLLVSKDMKTPS